MASINLNNAIPELIDKDGSLNLESFSTNFNQINHFDDGNKLTQIFKKDDVVNYYIEFDYQSILDPEPDKNITSMRVISESQEILYEFTNLNVSLNEYLKSRYINLFDGEDSVIGNSDNDIIKGFLDDDVLDGKAGNDVLDGDLGSDRIIGGGKSDVFIIGHYQNNDNVDTIDDFENSDQIGLDGILIEDISFQVNNDGTDIFANDIHIATLSRYSDLIDDDLKALLF